MARSHRFIARCLLGLRLAGLRLAILLVTGVQAATLDEIPWF